MSNDVVEAARSWALALPETVECPHQQTEWVPDDPTPGCEDGDWRCLDCGARKQKAYRPFLEHWEGTSQIPNPVRAAVLAVVGVSCGETRDQRNTHAMLDMMREPGEPHDKCSYCGNTEKEGYGYVAFDLDAAVAAFPEPARNDMRLAYLELLGMAYGFRQPMSEAALLAAFGGVR